MASPLTVAALRNMLDGRGVPNDAKVCVRLAHSLRETEAVAIGYRRDVRDHITGVVIYLEEPVHGSGGGMRLGLDQRPRPKK